MTSGPAPSSAFGEGGEFEGHGVRRLSEFRAEAEEDFCAVLLDRLEPVVTFRAHFGERLPEGGGDSLDVDGCSLWSKGRPSRVRRAKKVGALPEGSRAHDVRQGEASARGIKVEGFVEAERPEVDV